MEAQIGVRELSLPAEIVFEVRGVITIISALEIHSSPGAASNEGNDYYPTSYNVSCCCEEYV